MAWEGGGGSQGGQWDGGLFNRGSQDGLMLSPQLIKVSTALKAHKLPLHRDHAVMNLCSIIPVVCPI